MPNADGQKAYINLTKGLVTEVNPLAFPEGASVDELNMQVDHSKLSRVRRKSLTTGQESNLAISTEQTSNVQFSTFLWKNPGNKAGEAFLVVQSGRYLSFFDGREGSDLSSTKQLFAFDLHAAGTFPTEGRGNRCTFANAAGALLVTRPSILPIVIQYTGSTIEVYDIAPYIRDFKGVDDSLEVSERPVLLSEEHEYNLLNQGWHQARRNEASGGAYADPIARFNTVTGTHPSNADISYLGLKTDNNGDELFNPQTLRDQTFGNTLAPRGHYVFYAWGVDREAKRISPQEDGSPSTTLRSLPIRGPLT